MTTKRVPPGHDHSQDMAPVVEETKENDKKTSKPVEEVIPLNRRLPKEFKR